MSRPARAPNGVAPNPPPAAAAPAAARRGVGIQWGLLLNLALMVFLFSGGMWRNTVMITLAILIYLYDDSDVAVGGSLMFRSAQVANWVVEFAISIQSATATKPE